MQNMSVLLAGVETADRGVVDESIRLAGLGSFLVLEAASGSRALDLCIREKPKIILINHELPDMSGWALLEMLSEYQWRSEMRLVLILPSEDPVPGDIQRAGRLGLDDIVFKPIQPGELGARLGLKMNMSSQSSGCQVHFCQLASWAGLGYWEYNQVTDHFFCSPALNRILGYTWDQESSGSIFLKEHISEADIARLEKSCQDLEPGEGFSLELICYRVDREERYLRVLGRKNNRHETALTTGIIQDITQQKRVERKLMELVEQTSMQAAALEQSGEGVVITDRELHVVYVNPFFDQTSGFRASELLHYLKQEASFEDPAYFYREQAGGANVMWKGQLSLRDKNGNTRQVDVIVSPVRDRRSREVVNYVLLVRDVTEKLNLEKQLQQAQKMEAIGTLAGGIAHDFNNSLMGIQGFTELAMNHLPGDSRSRDYLNNSLLSCRRAKDLVQQILTFSGEEESSSAPMQVKHAFKEALKLLEITMPANVELETHIDSDPPMIRADPTRVHQVIMNLCTNALHAMPGGGTLRVRLQGKDLDSGVPHVRGELLPGRYLVLEVEDTGQGMDQDTARRIFDPFFTTKPRSKGTGLGLSVIHGIVEDLSGCINVQSIPGQGSRFSVYFPASTESSSGESPGVQPGAHEIVRGKGRILFVDDHEDIMLWGSRALEGLGYQVHGTSDSARAWDIFRNSPDGFDLLVTDLSMPGLSGDKLTKKVKRLRPGLPVIICTGFAQSSAVSNIQEQADGILYKPYSMAEFSRLVRSLIQVKDTV